jgi:acid phosphatase type 7
VKVRVILILCFILPLNVFSQSGGSRPERIILNITEAPATSIAVTWRMSDDRTDAGVQFARATPGTEFTNALVRLPAIGERLSVPKQPVAFHYSAVLKDLQAGTTYVYRVGRDSAWSEWCQFTTAQDSTAPFSFVWFGDPQDDIVEYISRVFRQSTRTMPDAKFWLFSGDITSEPEDDQLGEFFDAAGPVLRGIPSAMVPGNHDMAFRFVDGEYARNAKGKKVRDKDVSPMWHAHFTLPGNGIPDFTGTSYTFDYQGVRFVMINSNDHLEEQAAWMEPLLAKNPCRWTVVAFHHPVYSSGRDRDDRETREAFLPLFDRYHVDLVLTGHDHTYARSRKLVNNAVVPELVPGTVYVTSSSGPKFYEYTSLYDSLMARTAVRTQFYQTVAIDGTDLRYRAFTADGSLYDAFDLKK